MSDEKLQMLLDKDEIRDLIAKYAQGADNFDPDMYSSVFTPDFEIEFSNFGVSARGMAEWREVLASDKLRPLIAYQRDTSTHITSNEVIDVNGDEATGFIHCVAHIIGTKDGEPYSTLHGLTYEDRYRRIQGNWKICHRRLTLKWVTEGVPSSLPV